MGNHGNTGGRVYSAFLFRFKVNSDIGLMTAITISIALALDFLFLPTLLIKLEEKSHKKVGAEHYTRFAPAAAGYRGPDG